MSDSNPGYLIPQDIVPTDGEDDVIVGLPVTQDEIDDLLYGEDRPPAQRIERLREIGTIMREQQPADTGNDAAALLGEIEDAIARLAGGVARQEDGGLMDGVPDDNPLDHRETLSPDSDELLDLEAVDEASLGDDLEDLDEADDLEAIEGDDDLKALDEVDGADGLDVLDPEEWDEGDGIGRA